ncbi:MAG: aminotransferase family protein [Desulfurispora sp.]|uniref:aminotransferase family protein n=1 Tax=Desulfurispora sp. TaxID=3014275 RepID=UPI004049C0BA
MPTATIDPAVLEKWDQEYIWHPFTQMQQYQQEKPLIIERGEGSYLYDVYGNKYLDGVSSLWVTVHGHCHPRINRAIIRQLEKVAHSTLLGLSNVPAILLAQRLVQMAPAGLSKVFYSDSGATAVEIAIKMAYQYWQQQGNEPYRHKKKFLCLQLAYHGDTIGAVSVGGIDTFHRIFAPLLFETITAPAPYCYRCPWQQEQSNCRRECLQELEKIIQQHQHELAAMIMEPLVQGAAGLMVGIELVLDRTSKEPYPPEAQIGHRVILAARQKGLILRPLGHVLVLMPVLTMSIDELRQMLTITYESIAQVTGA